jgi:hypothetical protein
MARIGFGFGFADTKIGVERLAFRLMWAYARMVFIGQRPIDRKVTAAEFSGMCKAANAVGYGHTENHVDMVVRDVMNTRPQPAFNNGAARIEWEREATAALTAALDEII